MALRRASRAQQEQTFSSWSGEGSITIGGRRGRGRLELADALILGCALVAWDFAALLIIGVKTSSATSLCTPDGCSPDPAAQVRRVTIGLVAYAIAVLLPIVVAGLRRRGLVTAVIIQAIAAVIMFVEGTGNLHDAHANLHQVCTAPPAPTAHECR